MNGEAEKPKLVAHFARLIRRHRLDYPAFEAICKAARKETGLRRPARSRRLPRVLPQASLRKFYEAVDQGGNLQHAILLRLLFYTAVRVSELAAIRVEDLDLDTGKIFIERGKGDKDRYILFPESFRLALKAYLAANPDNEYLFESRHRRPYTARRIQQIVQEYAEHAGIPEHVHPHLFRHQMLTWLTAQGLPDAAIVTLPITWPRSTTLSGRGSAGGRLFSIATLTLARQVGSMKWPEVQKRSIS